MEEKEQKEMLDIDLNLKKFTSNRLTFKRNYLQREKSNPEIELKKIKSQIDGGFKRKTFAQKVGSHSYSTPENL
jgi:hypothetical protein